MKQGQAVAAAAKAGAQFPQTPAAAAAPPSPAARVWGLLKR